MIKSGAGTPGGGTQGPPNSDAAGVALVAPQAAARSAKTGTRSHETADPSDGLRCASHVYVATERARCELTSHHDGQCAGTVNARVILLRGAVRQHRATVRWWGK